MCKKQTAVSHSSTESEIISLDTGLRLDGLLALELWDLIVSVLGNVSRVSDGSGKLESDVHKRHKPHKKIDVMENIDSVPSNVQSSRQEALLYVFEDNEAVIKMIIKGRSPTMRLDYGRSWSSQEWRSEGTTHDRSGQPDKTSWRVLQDVCPHHGDPLLDGNAQSVRYGEIIHDGSGQPDCVNSQEEANSQNFIMGNDATEFVNRVNDEVQKRQKRMSNVASEGEEHFIIW